MGGGNSTHARRQTQTSKLQIGKASTNQTSSPSVTFGHMTFSLVPRYLVLSVNVYDNAFISSHPTVLDGRCPR